MNAYELADQVEMWGEDLLALNMKGGIPVIEGAKMLRQQAKELDEAGHMIGVLREYISDLENGLDSSIKLNKAQAERQVKELTDEEIQEVAHGFGAIGWMGDTTYEFGRAILRKAQEK
jgi:3-deoxy-D-arabino-heptulosonate 7-phosphate (DAHP) synthase class II